VDGALYDVLQVGYGPVGEALAPMLGLQPRKLAVCERWSNRYPLPRAVCVDHEISRVLLGSVKNLGRYAASWIAWWPNRPSSRAALT